MAFVKRLIFRSKVLDPQLIAFLHLHQDLNALPYKFYSATSGQKELGNFVQAEVADSAFVQTWAACTGQWYPGSSAFQAVWLGYVSQSSSFLLKFHAMHDPIRVPQGLVHLDHNKPCEDASLRLLETAPDNQEGATPRAYLGVGKALVVRLVLECYIRGQQRLYFRVSPRNIPFYLHLNFASHPFYRDVMTLSLQDAEQLLREFFL